MQLISGFTKSLRSGCRRSVLPVLAQLFLKLARLELTQMALFTEAREEAPEHLQEAISLIQVTHGKDHPLYKDACALKNVQI